MTKNQANSFLCDLADNLTFLAMQKLGADEDTGKNFGEEVTRFLAQHWGGQTIYFPVDIASRLATRNERLFAEFTGDNQAELAKKYRLTTQHVYKIIKTERAKRKVK